MSYTCDSAYLKDRRYKIITYQELMFPVKEECTLGEEKKVYEGLEILKMIKEGELFLGTKLKSSKDLICRVAILFTNKFVLLQEDLSPVPIANLMYDTFTLAEKEYMTFDEAKKSDKKFKYKYWDSYYTLKGVLNILCSDFTNEEINKMLDEKAWEVES